MNLEGPPVKAVPESIGEKTHAAKFASQNSARMFAKQGAASTRRDTVGHQADIARAHHRNRQLM